MTHVEPIEKSSKSEKTANIACCETATNIRHGQLIHHLFHRLLLFNCQCYWTLALLINETSYTTHVQIFGHSARLRRSFLCSRHRRICSVKPCTMANESSNAAQILAQVPPKR